MYFITDELTAWSFDRAVWLFGTELESELRDAADGAKNKNQAHQRQMRVMAQYGLGEVRYRDPAAGAGGKQQDAAEANKPTDVTSESTGPVKL